MQFCDLLRMTVLLSAGAATALGAVTVIVADRELDTRTLIVAAVWWAGATAAGLVFGRPGQAAEAMRPLLTEARMTPTLPTDEPGRVALARLWPVGAFALIAGIAGIFFPGVSAIGAGFGIVAALSLRGWERAVEAIEERDGVRFYVEPGSAFTPVTLVRTPGLRKGASPLGPPPPPPAAAG